MQFMRGESVKSSETQIDFHLFKHSKYFVGLLILFYFDVLLIFHLEFEFFFFLNCVIKSLWSNLFEIIFILLFFF